MGKYVLLVFSNPVAGREMECGKWYDDVHIPDIMRVPGFTSAQRGVLSDVQLPNSPRPPQRMVAIYEIETDDIAKWRDDVVATMNSDRIVRSDAFDRSSMVTQVYECST